eukprot:Hpha_TRINITY_DN11839_c0_g1::TRINITY_DN11839_c0_g1_i1::g.1770::m.1770/K06642/PRKDC; DNA-dependent protein kinase catalytic subunit
MMLMLVMVSSVDANVLVMDSMQKPKRLLIRTTDETEHPYLVKGGEDLRQDQRIQSLFRVMGHILAADGRCAQRGLRLRPYSVVPISPRAGLLEWVEGCAPLKVMVQSQFRAEHGKSLSLHPAMMRFQNFILHCGGTRRWIDGYRKLFNPKDYGKSDLSAKFEELLQPPVMDTSYLRRALAGLCLSPAAYQRLRLRFLSSWACAGVAQWLLGIGDRHSDNFLIDQSSGEVVPIDFGYAFGTATETLQLPELLPLRLTPQITEIAEPVGTSLLRGKISTALSALRDERRLLLDVLAVFIREPLSHWQKTALRRFRRRAAEEDSASVGTGTAARDRYAETKVGQVRRKLDLGNPWVFVAEDLRANAVCAGSLPDEESRENACRLLRGSGTRRFRSGIGERCRDVNEQAACLIDMATDPNLLCRTYIGWGPVF